MKEEGEARKGNFLHDDKKTISFSSYYPEAKI